MGKKRKKKLSRKIRQSRLGPYIDEKHLQALLDIPEVLKVFQKVDKLPRTSFTLSAPAQLLFEQLENYVIDLARKPENQNQLQAWLDFPSKAVENAINLHLIRHLTEGDTVPTVIDKEVLKHSIQVTAWQLHNDNIIPPLGIPIERV